MNMQESERAMMDASLLKPDCEKCAALCCISLAFDASEDFPIDKPNGVACPQLNEQNQCRIYDTREQEGYRGCLRFDCLGAGQRVTQELFSGRSWRSEPQILGEMTDAFMMMRQVQEHLALLTQAAKLPLRDEELEELETLYEHLVPEKGWSEASFAALDLGWVKRRVQIFCQSLRHHVA